MNAKLKELNRFHWSGFANSWGPKAKQRDENPKKKDEFAKKKELNHKKKDVDVRSYAVWRGVLQGMGEVGEKNCGGNFFSHV